MKMKKYLLAIYVFSALFLHSQQAFADLIAICYGSQSEYVKCRGNPDISSVLISRGKLTTTQPAANMGGIPPSANAVVVMSAGFGPSDAKFSVISPNPAGLGQALFFECTIAAAANYPLFQTASAIISASSTGLDSDNSYYTQNNLLITRDKQQHCTNISYSKVWK